MKGLLKQNDELMTVMRNDISTTQASVKKLEVQVGQIAESLSERSQGSLPSNTKKNPRDTNLWSLGQQVW